MNKINFTKMHGIGNDYIYINCLNQGVANPASLARSVSRRHFGIGSDGLVLILPSLSADFFMRVYNNDGSQAPMCGNAIRCVGKYVYERGLTDKREISIETLSGIKHLTLAVQNNSVKEITVDMGIPLFENSQIPVSIPGEEVMNYPWRFQNKEFPIHCVNIGNPHCVIFTDELNDGLVNRYGPLIENSPIFPEKTNVEFVKVLNRDELEMRVWERGSGETLACGTGATASAIAAHKTGRTGHKITVHLRGGNLIINWKKNRHVYMTGSADFVYDGVIPA